MYTTNSMTSVSGHIRKNRKNSYRCLSESDIDCIHHFFYKNIGQNL